MKEKFRDTGFQKKKLILLDKIKEILAEYHSQGIKVTLRQLYYQLVTRLVISNKSNEYHKLSSTLTKARYTGHIDWDAVEDRVRIPEIPSTFRNVGHLLQVAAKSYQLDRWQDQEYYIELWTEKDALSSVITPITEKYQVTFCVNRGYTSASSMYESAQRLSMQEDKKLVILYLGDFDPSGLDMDRDIKDRLTEFGIEVEVIRVGLTLDQVKEYQLPSNPAKENDPRSKWFNEEYGDESWEVDALKPEVLYKLIEFTLLSYLDFEKYELVRKREQEEAKTI